MQRVPPLDRKTHDRNIDRAYKQKDRARLAAALGIVERAAQDDVAAIGEKQDQDAGKPRVPDPPRAPCRLAPDAAGDEAQGGERRPNRRGGDAENIRERVFCDQQHGGGNRHRQIEPERNPRRRNMHIHDAHGFALLVIGRRGVEGEIKAAGKENKRRERERRHRLRREAHEFSGIGEARNHFLISFS